jgi:hypothetical protein
MSGPALLHDLADAPHAHGLNVGPGEEDGWVTPPPVELADGTRLYLYKDGEGLRAGLGAIAAAKRRICLEMYIFANDATGRAYADLLARRARDGLAVYLIYDSFGSVGSAELIDKMRAAGVRVAEFHPMLPWRGKYGWRLFSRDHRKLLVCDDRVAGLGGINNRRRVRRLLGRGAPGQARAPDARPGRRRSSAPPRSRWRARSPPRGVTSTAAARSAAPSSRTTCGSARSPRDDGSASSGRPAAGPTRRPRSSATSPCWPARPRSRRRPARSSTNCSARPAVRSRSSWPTSRPTTS